MVLTTVPVDHQYIVCWEGLVCYLPLGSFVYHAALYQQPQEVQTKSSGICSRRRQQRRELAVDCRDSIIDAVTALSTLVLPLPLVGLVVMLLVVVLLLLSMAHCQPLPCAMRKHTSPAARDTFFFVLAKTGTIYHRLRHILGSYSRSVPRYNDRCPNKLQCKRSYIQGQEWLDFVSRFWVGGVHNIKPYASSSVRVGHVSVGMDVQVLLKPADLWDPDIDIMHRGIHGV